MIEPAFAGRPLLIRADASSEIGTGHVMRCLALAQAWQAGGGAAVFAQHACPDGLAARLRDEGIVTEVIAAVPGSTADAAETATVARRLGAEWVVVDGYVFGAEYQEALCRAEFRVLFIDDYGHAERYTADLVLNQNLIASPALYASRALHTRLLLGTQYVLLRQEFWRWRTHRHDRVTTTPCRILITFGGSDHVNLSSTMIDVVGQVKARSHRVEGTVLVGGGNSNADALRAKAMGAGLDVIHDARDMPSLLSQVDVAVTAGGSTCWEMAYMGVPSIVLVLAENQRENAARLEELEVSINLGWHEDVAPRHIAERLRNLIYDRAMRDKMKKRGTALVDGLGGTRVISELGNHLTS